MRGGTSRSSQAFSGLAELRKYHSKFNQFFVGFAALRKKWDSKFEEKQDVGAI